MPEDLYAHLGLKHKKIKSAQALGASLDPKDPDLIYTSANPAALPEKDKGEGMPSALASTSSPTPAAASSDSSDAGIYEDAEVGEEIRSEEPADTTKEAAGGIATEDAAKEVADVDDSHPL